MEQQKTIQSDQQVSYTPHEHFNLYLNFIDKSDEKLVDVEIINTHADRYISSYYSDTMKNYNKLYTIIWQKYNGKKYKVSNNSRKLDVISANSGDVLLTLNKPLYGSVLDEIDTMTKQRSYLKDILDYEYDKIIRLEHVEAHEKISVENMKKQYIDLLTRLYTYKLYYAKINNILNNDSEKLVVIQDIKPSFKDGVYDDSIPLLNAKAYRISKSLIENINKVNSAKLDLYNEIRLNLQILNSNDTSKEQKKKVRDMIIQYLDTTEKNENDAILNTAISSQNNNISHIIIELPEISDECLALLKN